MLAWEDDFRCVFQRVLSIMCLLCALFQPSFSQERCGTVENQRLLKNQETQDAFEQWLSRKLSDNGLRVNAVETPVEIPVVVHIIHKGEAVGTGTNVSGAQVLSQIKILNQDFSRANADTVDTPDEFRPVAGRIKISFVLARQSPDGLPTTGIVRARGSKNVWTIDDDDQLKAVSYWPAEDYLNLWVTDLATTLLGYAQFPVSRLPGLEGAGNNRLTDGVVIDYKAFGSIDDGNFDLLSGFNKGRAATHEVGHFFGLRHIWGDDNGSCGGSDDFVSDTPDQSANTSGCPGHPHVTCGRNAMFQNYMDYTNDNCMNIFTQGQISRVKAVLENSVRRKTLSISHGLINPLPLPDDLGIETIVSPPAAACNNVEVPRLNVKNHGTNPIASASLKLTVNDVEVETRAFTLDPALDPGESTDLTFSAVPLIAGTNNFVFEILLTNAVADSKQHDNKKSTMTTLLNLRTLPFAEDFNTLPSDWSIQNPDQKTTWAHQSAPHAASSNAAMGLSFFQHDATTGESDRLISPWFDPSGASGLYLVFDVAYARYQNRQDELRIYARADCKPPDEAVLIYAKSGSALATTTESAVAFLPSGEAAWRKEVIDLSTFTGNGKIQLVFEGVNDRGNNLYIDNVRVVSALSENIAVKKILRPSAVQCASAVEPVVTVGNTGEVVITHFYLRYWLNDDEARLFSVSDIYIAAGGSLDVTLPELTLAAGTNTLALEAADPNGVMDKDLSDNMMTTITVLNSASEVIPLRENFEQDAWKNKWTSVNPSGGMQWKQIETNLGESLYFNAWLNTDDGDEAWLVSPVLDLSGAAKAGLFFDVSYRYSDLARNDRLRVLASRNCGVSFDEIVFDQSGSGISDNRKSSAWVPSESTHWKNNFLNLNAFAGEEQVRLVFVATNRNGNNLYLDNIEFFLSDDSTPVVAENPYAIYGNDAESPDDFYITFNLDNRQPVTYVLAELTGRELMREDLHDVLNQTFRVACESIKNNGIYIVRLQIGDKYYAEKIWLSR